MCAEYDPILLIRKLVFSEVKGETQEHGGWVFQLVSHLHLYAQPSSPSGVQTPISLCYGSPYNIFTL
jgi:hypothetical protein